MATRRTLELDLAGERVPAIFLHPNVPEPVPAALLIHGLTSHKERMAESIGRSLLRHGVASLAVDLPLHGERDGTLDRESLKHPLQLVLHWRQALAEAKAGIEWLARQDEAPLAVDPGRIGLVGYSLGSFLGVAVAASEREVRAVVLAAGGDLPEQTPFAALVRTIPDPLRSVARLRGRPLLMVNGRYDRTVQPAQAERLYERAAEPREIRWYNGGHWPPAAAIDGAASWLAERLEADGMRAAGAG